MGNSTFLLYPHLPHTPVEEVVFTQTETLHLGLVASNTPGPGKGTLARRSLQKTRGDTRPETQDKQHVTSESRAERDLTRTKSREIRRSVDLSPSPGGVGMVT